MIIETNEININHEIEKIVQDSKDGYIEAILTFCESYDLDPAYVAKHLSKPIIEKIRAEGELINLLKKSAKLPL
jgi:benzoyl-CoA reductase/2-hydroxyglutaryl-CoA dehydratase subunit BcrC/BadD/HgdB